MLLPFPRDHSSNQKIDGSKNLTPEEFFEILIDHEYLYRKNNRLTRLLQGARLRIPQACFEEIDYGHHRGLVKSKVLELQNTDWIEAARNILITGPTGVGKSYLASALGQWACRQGYAVLYQRCPRLLGDLYASRGEGAYLKHLGKLARVKVLIIDDFGLHTMTASAIVGSPMCSCQSLSGSWLVRIIVPIL